MNEATPSPERLGYFDARAWDPRFTMKFRGFSTASLFVYPGINAAYPSKLEKVLHRWGYIQYRWPAAVVEWLLPLGGRGELVDIEGKLGRTAVRGGSRLTPILEKAGFKVVKVTRWGWDAPRRVAADQLGEHAHEVPGSLLAS